MPEALRTREWVAVDYYAVLGVPVDAGDDDIARAFRGLVKRLHPDAGANAVEPARFHEVRDAYRVLSDPVTRRQYDEFRASLVGGAAYRLQGSGFEPVRVTRTPTARFKAGKPFKSGFTRRRAWTTFVVGALLAVLGLLAAYVTFSLHQRDARQRDAGVAAVAQRVRIDNAPFIRFTTAAGEVVTVRQPEKTDMGVSGADMKIRYNPDDPRDVVVDESSLGRDITLAIVAIKLLFGGIVFAIIGARRIARARDEDSDLVGATAAR